MLKKLKEFLFGSQSKQSSGYVLPEYESGICFYCNKDGEMFVDVDIKDYEDETIHNFAKVLCGITSFNFHIETLNIIKTGFEENGRLDKFESLLNEILVISQEEIYAHQDLLGKKQEEPCIKPSDML